MRKKIENGLFLLALFCFYALAILAIVAATTVGVVLKFFFYWVITLAAVIYTKDFLPAVLVDVNPYLIAGLVVLLKFIQSVLSYRDEIHLGKRLGGIEDLLKQIQVVPADNAVNLEKRLDGIEDLLKKINSGSVDNAAINAVKNFGHSDPEKPTIQNQFKNCR